MTEQYLPLRQTLVFATALLYWGGVYINAKRVKKQIGHSPNLKPRSTKEWGLWLSWLFVILAWMGQALFLPLLQAQLLFTPVNFMPPLSNFIFSSLLVILGYAGTLWCYRTMQDSWRIGINTAEKLTLVTTGPYRYVRHPIYTLQMIILIAMGMLIPTLFSLGFIILHFICCAIKASDEEKYLLASQGQPYQLYYSSSGRFLPKYSKSKT
ncbi:MAG: isoprenylcysteine carboxylmethyltransferase family protein [Gammaproteobacteria bacterium]